MISAMEYVVVHLLVLSNLGRGVGGFSLRSCYLSGGSAICSLHKLTEVPTDIPSTVKTLDLSRNNISKIQGSDFLHFQNLTTLKLKENSISHIGKHTFSKLISLKQLVLSSNKIGKLEDDVFDGLSKLSELLLDSNPIQTVEPNAFRALNNLKLLELSNNRLCSVAQVHLATRHMPQLNELRIRNIGITTFRSQDLTNTSTEITLLDVSENPLERFEVSDDVFPKLTELYIQNRTVKSNLSWAVPNRNLLRHVTTLDVSGVQLASVDEWRNLYSNFNSSLTVLNLGKIRNSPSVLINLSCSMSKLLKLQIQTNSLIIGPNLFQMCHKVTFLDLQDNSIKRIFNGSFGALRRLKTLVLRQNRLQKVPFAIRNLTFLQTLDLSSNHIKTTGCQDFTGLKNLKELNLQQNKITALSNCSFLHLSLLKVLKLQKNSIVELGSAFQSSLANLKSLFLDQNKLMIIAPGTFRGLRSLTDLSLAQNQICTLKRGCFSGLTNLMSLRLPKNNLKNTALNHLIFEDLLNLRRLDLQNNAFKLWQSSPLPGPSFINLSCLESLQISGRSAAGYNILPSNFLQGLSNLSVFACNKLEISNVSNNIFSHTPRLRSLDISSNNLFDLSPELFAPIPHLNSLKIGDTNLGSLDFLLNAKLTKLTFLKAQKNVFSVISEDIIRSVPSLLELDLKQNSFTCKCENSWLVQWIQNNNQTQVRDAHSFKCNYPPECKGSKLLELNVQSCLVDVGFLSFIFSSCLNVLILLVSFIFHFSRFQLTYAYYIFLAWLYDSKNRQKRAASRYDAFVSYNTGDEAWVYEELVPRLEQEQGWRLCLHHRDFLPGKPIVENMADAIYGSRKTICVISQGYLQSEWCSKELQLASFRLFDEHEDVLILLFLEDIPSSHLSPYYRMKRLLRRRSYLSWPRAAENPQLFWKKLQQALRSTSSGAEDRLRLTIAH
ncbi:uncharacterized protein [Eucyclogobius newberryi]|uniref:uncharacterized protein n=1 Tax=Eucyclogobius newberryi TaxID=166745 RepID=UPI003B5C3525